MKMFMIEVEKAGVRGWLDDALKFTAHQDRAALPTKQTFALNNFETAKADDHELTLVKIWSADEKFVAVS